MQFTETEARWFIGIAIILGCAFVALLCDYLKGVNERLRERTMELLARAEESRYQAAAAGVMVPDPAAAGDRAAMLDALAAMRRDLDRAMKEMASRAAAPPPAATAAAPVAMPEPVPAPAPRPAVEPEPAAPEPALYEDRPARPVHPPLQPAIAPLLAATSASRPPVTPMKPNVKPMESHPKPLEIPKRVAILPGMQETLARVLPPEPPPAPEPVAEEQALNPNPNVVKIRVLRSQQPIETEKQALFHPAAAAEPVVEPVALAEPEPQAKRSSNDPWSYAPGLVQQSPEIATPMPTPTPQPVAVPEPSPVPEAPIALPQEAAAVEVVPGLDGSLALPSGMHDRPTLDVVLADPVPFTGLVVSIGINDFNEIRSASGEDAAAELVGSIANLVTSLTSNLGGPQHFACKVAADEFVICYNGEIGPVAQRRMSALSERLWDFQLRSMGTFSVVFSWGATEANEEPLSDAIDAAGERMRETRQNRASMGGSRGSRRVVA